MADQHFADFRIQVTRLTGGTEADIVKRDVHAELDREEDLTDEQLDAWVATFPIEGRTG